MSDIWYVICISAYHIWDYWYFSWQSWFQLVLCLLSSPKLPASERNAKIDFHEGPQNLLEKLQMLVKSVAWVRSKDLSHVQDPRHVIGGVVIFYLRLPHFSSNWHQNELDFCGHFKGGPAFSYIFYYGKLLLSLVKMRKAIAWGLLWSFDSTSCP